MRNQKIFKKHNISLIDLLREIPEAELTRISRKTNVDYYSKVLHGKLMFYLLTYGMLSVDRLSQRGLRDAFSSPLFNSVFNIKAGREISHSSISERLNMINVDFFKESYELIYKRFSSLYTEKEIAGMSLQRVDSTIVKESGNKLKEGMTTANQHTKRKMIKYTINFDGMFGSLGNAHKFPSYINECLALPENVIKHFKKDKNHSGVYVFDRGMNSAAKFGELNAHEGLSFIGRLVENRRMVCVESFPVEDCFTDGILLEDGLYQLYKRVTVISGNGKESHRSELMEEQYRVIRFIPNGKKDTFLLITNKVDLTPDQIAEAYRHRWDIEVFFRFLKQELNFSHFISLSENGIQVILYMTLITAMLVMIYKKENELGYKTAIRRMKIELEALALAIIVIESGGDLKKIQLPDP